MKWNESPRSAIDGSFSHESGNGTGIYDEGNGPFWEIVLGIAWLSEIVWAESESVWESETFAENAKGIFSQLEVKATEKTTAKAC